MPTGVHHAVCSLKISDLSIQSEGRYHGVLGFEQASKLRRVYQLAVPVLGVAEMYRAAYAFWHADKQLDQRAEASVPLSALLGPKVNAALVASGCISHVRHHRTAGTAQSGNPVSNSNVAEVARASKNKSQRGNACRPQIVGSQPTPHAKLHGVWDPSMLNHQTSSSLAIVGTTPLNMALVARMLPTG